MSKATPADITKACQTMVPLDKYKPDASGTKCSEFLRDLAADTFKNHDFDKLEANSIHEKIRTSNDWVRHFSSEGNKPISKEELEAAFKTAQDDANEGFFVVVAMKVGAIGVSGGHCSTVVPGQLTASGDYSKAGLASAVPFVAQAGKDIFAGKALSFGITSADFKKNPMIVASNRT